ncbi:MAG TPA: bifunctional diaminohydroxyphosphoribosylaminopyrimidine deaminase/5-amino-6-(5-phosphoribosylamino)uracil reductase RibD [Candidatus Fermentibacter daniensis]|nr:bifunctional diaminohydroxyphosphoribosylaminopyrimidine deaminase/5-amino-6-(5-phosphoribosylamino)uracil reductase RibD [Candidatus Fermentibacter daniensis]HOR07184.1 bifunctional diaminohydroxyphosphoribosylaminopyrimidine deaminase/5-amino-6-(5-phosphoribosylamino)uracil reductase RibD [Candidatus Fermentibacter daniensis]HPK51857.1 bifunctional diaminohydroxyphosphoribosylaminopyrimidine deaminase/5-amino-6-(5-phosphoribosylamino)uracil reductase RibD [Candidatus Fermentibacter daniensis
MKGYTPPVSSEPAVDSAMREALALSLNGRGGAFPNPMVGAVVLGNGDGGSLVVGRGWHGCCGGPHAEAVALDEAGELARGATLVVTLEPCCHTGRTDPCVERIISSGISRVVAAMADPDPRMDGRGFEALRAGGVEVEVGLMAGEAALLNRVYLHYKRTGRSFLHLKLAATLDGRIAARDGSSRWITSGPARARAGSMRAEAGAVLVGAGTVLADDPSLLPPEPQSPAYCRLVAAGRRPLPAGAKVFDRRARTVVAHPGESRPYWVPEGVETLPLPEGPPGLDVHALLEGCASLGVGEVLCEGGAALATSLVSEGLVDRLSFFTAPALLGGEGLPVFGPLGIGSISEALEIEDARIEILGCDVLVEGGIVHRPG